jgi:hypothetical protein
MFLTKKSRAETRLAKIRSQILGAPQTVAKETTVEGLTKMLERAAPQVGTSL